MPDPKVSIKIIAKDRASKTFKKVGDDAEHSLGKIS
jgi:hypothetical protein